MHMADGSLNGRLESMIRARRLAARAAPIVAALVACVALYGCGSDSSGDATAASASTSAASTTTSANSTSGTLPPASFASLPRGWKQFDDGGAELTKRGATTTAYATSWNFDPASGDGPAGHLPDDGAIVQALLLRRSGTGQPHASLCRTVPASRAYPPITGLPLQIADMKRGQLEGAPRVVEYRFQGTQNHDYRVDVRVDLAPDADRAAAQQALNSLRLPRWGDRC
jgi:hypothetical protein